MISLGEQVDRITGNLFRYSWLLEGVSGRKGEIRTKLESAGWKWIRGIGAPGCYTTEDYALAMQTGPHHEPGL